MNWQQKLFDTTAKLLFDVDEFSVSETATVACLVIFFI